MFWQSRRASGGRLGLQLHCSLLSPGRYHSLHSQLSTEEAGYDPQGLTTHQGLTRCRRAGFPRSRSTLRTGDSSSCLAELSALGKGKHRALPYLNSIQTHLDPRTGLSEA